jgi:hypothetical protein
MKALLALLPLLASLLMANTRAADALKLDPEGYIRDWVMLAPIPLPEGETAADALFRQQIRNEASLQPKAGDKVKVGTKELTWQNITNYVDFNATLKSINDHAVGYLVTYIECEIETPNVIMSVASNDEGCIYFNGVDIYAFSEPRTLMLDSDKGKVTLKKGTNVIVFKVINELNSWQGAMRLTDKAGAPLKDIKIKLTPPTEPRP